MDGEVRVSRETCVLVTQDAARFELQEGFHEIFRNALFTVISGVVEFSLKHILSPEADFLNSLSFGCLRNRPQINFN